MAQDSTPIHSHTAAGPTHLERPTSHLMESDGRERKEGHLTAEQQLEEQLEALSFELERSGRCTAMPIVDGSSGSDSLETNRREDFSPDSSHFVSMTQSRFDGLLFDHMTCGLNSDNATHYFSKSSSLNGNLNRQEQSIQKVKCKQLEDLMAPDPVQQKCSSLPVQLSAYPCEVSRHESVMYEEPDIIQSTKSLSRQQPITSTPILDAPGGGGEADVCLAQEGAGDVRSSETPVAPPRKKKSTKISDCLPSAIKVLVGGSHVYAMKTQFFK